MIIRARATAPVALMRLYLRDIFRNDDLRTALASTSREAGLREQSSNRNETRPGVGASGRAAAMYSIDFLSREFWDRSKNWRLLVCAGVIVRSGKMTSNIPERRTHR